jgi:glutamate racemase
MEAPIGIFDSGVGGLTVARAILDQLPDEQVIYVGDTAHVPYGPKPIADVRRYALECLDHLAAEGVKLLVIACNSAAAACLHDARERYPIPVVEVIRPAVRRAVAATRNGHIGVIGTRATITSKAYEDAFAAAPHVRVTSAACPQFVEFVERGITSGRALLGLAQSYLEPLQRAHVDTLVLGCTHYPLLAGLLGLVMGDDVTLVSSADETAKDVYRILVERDMLRPASDGMRGPQGEASPAGLAGRAQPPQHRFLATGDAAPFRRLASRFLGPVAANVGTLANVAGGRVGEVEAVGARSET